MTKRSNRVVAKEVDTEWVSLDDITRDPSFQVRAKLDGGTVLTYATMLRGGSAPPPIKLARINGALFLVDGWHRIRARERLLDKARNKHERRELSQIEASITDMTEAEARWASAIANLGHGLPLDRKAKREVFDRYMKLKRYRTAGGAVKSSRKIAEELGGWVSHVTVWTWIRQRYPAVASEMESENVPKRPDNQPPSNYVSPEMFPETAHGYLEAARAAARGIGDEGERKVFLEAVEGLAEEVKSGWKLKPDAF